MHLCGHDNRFSISRALWEEALLQRFPLFKTHLSMEGAAGLVVLPRGHPLTLSSRNEPVSKRNCPLCLRRLLVLSVSSGGSCAGRKGCRGLQTNTLGHGTPNCWPLKLRRKWGAFPSSLGCHFRPSRPRPQLFMEVAASAYGWPVAASRPLPGNKAVREARSLPAK